MKYINTLAIDLAKNMFQIYGSNKKETRFFSERCNRKQLRQNLVNYPRSIIGIEACAGAHYWARSWQQLGHQVKMISPQYVKPFVKTNKNDRNDAQGIYEAMRRPTMRFVPVKTVAQQDMLNLHNIYQRLVKERTALCNQLRAMLLEHGIVIAQGRAHLHKELPKILEDASNELSSFGRELVCDLQQELKMLDDKIQRYEQQIKQIAEDDRCRRLQTIPGIGPMSASLFVATLAQGYRFKRARDVSAFLGLVPRQNSSGDKTRLGNISKRGNNDLRCVLVHGARAVLAHAKNSQDPNARWAYALSQRRGYNKAAVGLASKNVRIAWAVLKSAENYSTRVKR
jgi:transposase